MTRREVLRKSNPRWQRLNQGKLSVMMLFPAMLGGAMPVYAGPVCDVSLFGPATQDPITISGSHEIEYDCELDFGPRAVVISGTLTSCGFVLRAANLTITSAGILQGEYCETTLIARAAGSHPGSVRIEGRIDHNSDVEGGTIQVIADGSVTVAGSNGRLVARGTVDDASGGSVLIEAGLDVTLNGNDPSINVSGESDAYGGEVQIISRSGNVSVQKTVEAYGGSGEEAAVSIQAAGNVNVTDSIRAHATSSGGYGGMVSIHAGRSITLGQLIDVHGHTGSRANGGGAGGYVTLAAGDDITVSSVVDLSAGWDESGGEFFAISRGAFSQPAGEIRAHGRVASSNGGYATVAAGGTATPHGRTDVHGGAEGSGGGVEVSGCEVTVSATGRFEAAPDGTIEFHAVNRGSFLGAASALPDGYVDFKSETAGAISLGGTISPEPSTWDDPAMPDCVAFIGDADRDLDSDLADTPAWAGCLVGPGTPLSPLTGSCAGLDAYRDGTIDLRDMASWQNCYGASSEGALTECTLIHGDSVR